MKIVLHRRHHHRIRRRCRLSIISIFYTHFRACKLILAVAKGDEIFHFILLHPFSISVR